MTTSLPRGESVTELQPKRKLLTLLRISRLGLKHPSVLAMIHCSRVEIEAFAAGRCVSARPDARRVHERLTRDRSFFRALLTFIIVQGCQPEQSAIRSLPNRTCVVSPRSARTRPMPASCPFFPLPGMSTITIFWSWFKAVSTSATMRGMFSTKLRRCAFAPCGAIKVVRSGIKGPSKPVAVTMTQNVFCVVGAALAKARPVWPIQVRPKSSAFRALPLRLSVNARAERSAGSSARLARRTASRCCQKVKGEKPGGAQPSWSSPLPGT